jgi:ABC-type bacteriocin/lantibiotic exporter with double-glycine peptidase domain
MRNGNLKRIEKNILKVPYWSQDEEEYTCGPICIRMVLSYLRGKRLNKREYLHIVDLTMDGNPKDSHGTSKQRMKSAIKKLGFKYSNIFGEKGLNKALERKHPVIAKCLMDDEYGDRYRHYIVVTGRDDKYFYINDPYAGKPGKILKKTFLSRAQKLNWGYKQWGIEVL